MSDDTFSMPSDIQVEYSPSVPEDHSSYYTKVNTDAQKKASDTGNDNKHTLKKASDTAAEKDHKHDTEDDHPDGGSTNNRAQKHWLRIEPRSKPNPYPNKDINCFKVSQTCGSKAYTFGSKRPSQTREINPGPGSYNLKQKVYNTGAERAHTFTMTSRKSLKKEDDTPGPGAYTPTLAQNNKRYPMGGQAKIGRHDYLKGSDGPGPGHYSYTGIYNTGKYSSIPARIVGKGASQVISESPGPASYNLDRTLVKGPGYKFTPRGTGPMDRNNYPGPGQYTPKDDYHVKGYKMSIGVPRQLYDIQDTPAPNQYNNASKIIGKNAPMITIQGRGRPYVTDITPGPGHYTPKTGGIGCNAADC